MLKTIGASLPLGLLLFASVAFADIDLDFISPTDATREPNQAITYTMQGDTDGNGESNDWRSTRVTISIPGPNNDISACVNEPNVQTDSNNATADVELNAPATDGDYAVIGTAYRHLNCNTARDSKETTLSVVTPEPEPDPEPDPEPEPTPEPEAQPSTLKGGGGLCNPQTGHPECQKPANYAYFANSNFGAPSANTQLVALYVQLILKLNQIVDLL